MTKTTKTTTSKRAFVRLTVQSGEYLRFFDVPLPSANRALGAIEAEELQSAVSVAAVAFSQTFDAELKSQRASHRSEA